MVFARGFNIHGSLVLSHSPLLREKSATPYLLQSPQICFHVSEIEQEMTRTFAVAKDKPVPVLQKIF
jgi:hypothetical protein